MEPFSFLGFVVISMAATAMLSIVSKKPNSPFKKIDEEPVTNAPGEKIATEAPFKKENSGVIDIKKEQEIEELIALHD